jgi:hypothetical protein
MRLEPTAEKGVGSGGAFAPPYYNKQARTA